jgi:hypothetical protein
MALNTPGKITKIVIFNYSLNQTNINMMNDKIKIEVISDSI